jgi:energy-coupling factor transport system substrate-specific component
MSSWKLREIVVLAVLAVVFAVIYLLFFSVGNVLFGIMGPMGYEIIFGIWFIVSIIAAYIIRKPGAAFFSETIAATIEVLIGNFTGPILIIVGMIQGAGAEAAFAATKWKKYTIGVLMCAGMGSAVFSFIWGYFYSGYSAYSVGLVVSMLVVRIISGALIAGVLGKWIGDALHKTGVLRSFAIGKVKKNEANINN